MPTDQGLFAEERSMVTMSFGDHIEELRRHLILALLGLFVGIVVTLIPPLNLGRRVVRQMQEPAQRTLGRIPRQAGVGKGRGRRCGRLLHADPHADTGRSVCSSRPPGFPRLACSASRLPGGPVCRAAPGAEGFRPHRRRCGQRRAKRQPHRPWPDGAGGDFLQGLPRHRAGPGQPLGLLSSLGVHRRRALPPRTGVRVQVPAVLARAYSLRASSFVSSRSCR